MTRRSARKKPKGKGKPKGIKICECGYMVTKQGKFGKSASPQLRQAFGFKRARKRG